MSEQGNFNLTVPAGREYINLRGNPGQAEFLSAVNGVLEQELPLQPNTASRGALVIYWMGPDEWLIAGDNLSQSDLAGRLDAELAGIPAAVNDLSGAMVAMQLTGAHVREVLSAGCPLDLDPGVFIFGECAQAGLAKASVLMAPTESPDGFELLVRRSFSDYVLLWLSDMADRVGKLGGSAQDST